MAARRHYRYGRFSSGRGVLGSAAAPAFDPDWGSPCPRRSPDAAHFRQGSPPVPKFFRSQQRPVPILSDSGVGCAARFISFIFFLVDQAHELFERFFKNPYLRGFFREAQFSRGLSVVFSSGNYNGSGMNVIAQALDGNACCWWFLVKICLRLLRWDQAFKGAEGPGRWGTFIGATSYGVLRAGGLLGLFLYNSNIGNFMKGG